MVRYFIFLMTGIIFLAGCAGPTLEKARFSLAMRSHTLPRVFLIDHGHYRQGAPLDSILSARPQNEGEEILREKVLIDLAIEDWIAKHGIPDAVELRFFNYGQTNWFIVYYAVPQRTAVFEKRFQDVAWLTIQEREKSRLLFQAAKLPGYVKWRLSGSLNVSARWEENCDVLADVLEISPRKLAPSAQQSDKDNSYLGDDIRAAMIKNLPRPAPLQEARVTKGLDRMRTALIGTQRSWRISSFGSPGAIAFSAPDGSIFVSDGLAASLSDDELTAVIAHLVSHERWGHGHSILQKDNLKKNLMETAWWAHVLAFGHPGGMGTPPSMKPVKGYPQLLMNRDTGYSLTQEMEANREALHLLQQIGIDPVSLFNAYLRLEEKSIKETPSNEVIGFVNMHLVAETVNSVGLIFDCGLLQTNTQ